MEPIERTSDWILSKYVQDDEPCKHGSWIWNKEINGWECFFCQKHMDLIVTEEEYQWLLSLCTRQG